MAPLNVNEFHDGAFSDVHFSHPLRIHLAESLLPQRSKRRVQFDIGEHVINPGTEYYTDDDIRIKWWGMDELATIRNEAKEMSRFLRKHEECDLTMGHRKTSLMLASDFKSLVKLGTETPDHHLRKWCAQDDGRRGLERFASKDYCCFRRRDINHTRSAVIAEQRKQKEHGFVDVEVTAQLARDASRRARSFAVFFAEADAAIVRAEEIRQPSFRRAPPRKRSKLYHDRQRMCCATA